MFKINVYVRQILLLGLFSSAVNCTSLNSEDKELLADNNEALAITGLEEHNCTGGDGNTEAGGTKLYFTGNAYQRQLFKEVVGIINRSGKTLTAYRDNAIIVAYLEATSHTCAVALKVIDRGYPFQATAWTDLAYLCEQATEIAKMGVLSSTESITKKYEDFIKLDLSPERFAKQWESTLVLFVNSNKEFFSSNESEIRTRRDNYEYFLKLPSDAQANQAAGLLLRLIFPSCKTKMLCDYFEALAPIDRVMKIEGNFLKKLSVTDFTAMTRIKGIEVPDCWSYVIKKLIDTGKITTAEEVVRWLRFFEAPLSSSLIDAMRTVMENPTRFLFTN